MTAIALAFLLWTAIKENEPVPIDGVPIEVRVEDPRWVLAGAPDPPTVSIILSGPVGELLDVALNPPSIIIPIVEVRDTIEEPALLNRYVTFGPEQTLRDTRVEEVRPNTVRLSFERVENRAIPVAVRTTGAPVPGFELAGPPQPIPANVQASGGRSRIAAMTGIDSIRLPAIDLSELSETDTVRLPVDTTGMGLTITPMTVNVVVPVRPIRADSVAGPGGGL